MKSQDIKVGVEYLVIPPWQTASKHLKDPAKIQDGRGLVAVTFTSLDRYKAENYSWSNLETDFALAEKGDKTWGLLAQDGNSNRWFVVKPSNVIAEAQPVRERWTREKQEQLMKEQQQELERERLERLAENRRAEADANLEGLLRNLTSMFGGRVNPAEITLNGYDIRNYPERTVMVTIPLDLVVGLQERYLEMKDQVDSY